MKEGLDIVGQHHRIVGATRAPLAMAVGLAIIAGGCGDATGTGSGSGTETVPAGVEKLKESMKERMAAKKGRPGGPRKAAGGP